MIKIKAKVLNAEGTDFLDTSVYIQGEKIFSIGGEYKAEKTYDFSDFYLIPGFIDAHIHIESSMMVPSQFSRAVLPHGTLAVVTDPHEIANVNGIQGIEFMIKDSEKTPLEVFFTAPSCVPATDMETSGARFGWEEIQILMEHPRCVGLGEVMNFPGVVNREPEIMKKISVAKKFGKVIDGHCPGLTGEDLKKYISAGIQSDHECTSLEEAREKASLGMHIMIREGSSMRNLESLYQIIPECPDRCMFVSDDIHPETILEDGHLDRILRKAVKLGVEPLTAIRLVTLNPAKYFSLPGLGKIEKGFYASFVVLEDLEDFKVHAVFSKGQLVYKEKLLKTFSGIKPPEEIKSSVNIKPFQTNDLKIKAKERKKVHIIVVPDERETDWLESDGEILVPDKEKDILPAIVMERHRFTGNTGKGFVKGFQIKGALASTVAHDSHNIVCVGSNYQDMKRAIEKIKEIGGGLVYTNNGKTECLELRISGLMSDQSAEEISEKLKSLHTLVRESGCPLESPFMVLAFLALPVIPKLKITDKGLVDVEKFQIINPIAE
ncbi:MAG: adenine deaminase [Candidatus Aenigmatarchaeota archaeon]|nr:MAG: adenine deaminase [Candidatus Aenigmarchaeota archaeon]